MKQYRHAIVVGASSGIGAEMVRQLAASGCKVVAVARRQDLLKRLASERPDLISAVVHDVTNVGEAPELFQKITGELGGLDLIVYAAGIMPYVGPGEFDFAKDSAMIDVNFKGAVAWLNEAAIRFQNTGRGTIVGIGSVAGDRGRAGRPLYNATKAGLATYLESLRNRLHAKGVTVVTIKPGPVATELIEGLGFKNPMPVDTAARIALEKSARAGEHYLSPVHRVIFAGIRLMPGFVIRKLKA